MANRTASFPHPVVGNGDDIAGEVKCADPEVDVTDAGMAIIVSGLSCSNSTIRGLVADQNAEFVIKLECRATLYRKAWRTTDDIVVVRLPPGAVHGTTTLSVRVCSKRDIASYRPDGLHADYADASFVLEAGAVLGVGPEFSFESDDEYDPLEGPVGSIFRVRETPAEDEPIAFLFDADRITINLCKKDFNAYSGLRPFAPLVHASLIIPPLAEAIGIVRKPDTSTDIENQKWFGRLRDMLAARGISDDEKPFVAATRLLDNPFRRASIRVQTILSSVEGAD